MARRATSCTQFADEADRQVIDALDDGDLEQPGHPLLDRAEAVFTILEHEAMHQETLLYMWHRLPFDQKRRPAGLRAAHRRRAAAGRSGSTIPAGCATLGVPRGSIAVRLGQRVSGAQRRGRRRSRSSATT